ncbi:MAG: SRPBCC family protein [Celeribacter sp.]
MKFSTKEDIGVPIETAFAAVSNFDGFQRQATRRGVEVTRLDSGPGLQLGASWRIRFAYRGKPREVTATLADWSPATGYRVTFVGGGIEGEVPVELVALSRQRTRLSIEIEMRPKTLSARVIIQTLRLAKSSLSRKFKKRVAEFAAELERRNAA